MHIKILQRTHLHKQMSKVYMKIFPLRTTAKLNFRCEHKDSGRAYSCIQKLENLSIISFEYIEV